MNAKTPIATSSPARAAAGIRGHAERVAERRDHPNGHDDRRRSRDGMGEVPVLGVQDGDEERPHAERHEVAAEDRHHPHGERELRVGVTHRERRHREHADDRREEPAEHEGVREQRAAHAGAEGVVLAASPDVAQDGDDCRVLKDAEYERPRERERGPGEVVDVGRARTPEPGREQEG